MVQAQTARPSAAEVTGRAIFSNQNFSAFGKFLFKAQLIRLTLPARHTGVSQLVDHVEGLGEGQFLPM